MRPNEIFLSHADKDRSFVKRLAGMLAGHGLKVWYSRRHLKGADQWHDEIGDALRRCNWFVIVLSPNSIRSEWVRRELIYALRKRRYRRRIVPILYKECDFERFSWTLVSTQRVDFTKGYRWVVWSYCVSGKWIIRGGLF